MKYRIVEVQNVFGIQSKKAWYTRWKYVKRVGSNELNKFYETRRGAQAAINLLKRTI